MLSVGTKAIKMSKKGRIEEINGSKVLRRFQTGVFIIMTKDKIKKVVDINNTDQDTYTSLATSSNKSYDSVRRQLVEIDKNGYEASFKNTSSDIRQALGHFKGRVYDSARSSHGLKIISPEFALAYLAWAKGELKVNEVIKVVKSEKKQQVKKKEKQKTAKQNALAKKQKRKIYKEPEWVNDIDRTEVGDVYAWRTRVDKVLLECQFAMERLDEAELKFYSNLIDIGCSHPEMLNEQKSKLESLLGK